jgi:hypothetical protein
MKYQDKPRAVSVRRSESREDEAPTQPLFVGAPMASPEPQRREMPLVVLIRPIWVDMPIIRLTWAFTRAAIAAAPALYLLSALWRILPHG